MVETEDPEAELEPEDEDEVEVEEELKRDDKRAAAAPQLRFTLHLRVLLQVISPLAAHGSYTERLLDAIAIFPEASTAE